GRRVVLEHKKADRPVREHLMKLLRPSAADPAAVHGLFHVALGDSSPLSIEAGDLIRKHHLNHPFTLAFGEGPWATRTPGSSRCSATSWPPKPSPTIAARDSGTPSPDI